MPMRFDRPVAQLAEHRSPKPGVGGSIPSCPASSTGRVEASGRSSSEAGAPERESGAVEMDDERRSTRRTRRLGRRRARDSVTGWWGRARGVPGRSPQRDEARHVAEPQGGLRDDARRDPDVGRSSASISVASTSILGVDSRGQWICGHSERLGMTSMTDDRTKQWYIVHTYSGFENKVKESLEQRVRPTGCRTRSARS